MKVASRQNVNATEPLCINVQLYHCTTFYPDIHGEIYIYKQYMLILERLPKHYYNNIFLFKYKPIALLQTNFLICH